MKPFVFSSVLYEVVLDDYTVYYTKEEVTFLICIWTCIH